MSSGEAHRRAGGRRSYNTRRQYLAFERRLALLRRVKELGGFSRGLQSRLARELGVSEATISRDFKAMLPLAVFCPCCDSLVPRQGLPALLAGILDQTGLGWPVATDVKRLATKGGNRRAQP